MSELGLNEAQAVVRKYPKPGAWHGEIYAKRQVEQQPAADHTLVYDKLIEQCPPLKDDAATIGTFNYYQGGHLLLQTQACNYQVSLTVTNPQAAPQTFTVVVNDLPQATLSLIHI